MRLLALCSVLAMLSPLSLCERRNPSVCGKDPGFECGDGELCDIPQGQTTGLCMQAECSTRNNTCGVGTPVCASGRCTPCTSDADCNALSSDTPLCEDSTGRCVGCVASTDCTKDIAKPICDFTAHTCRACTRHSECGTNGVCAKDAAFASLPLPDQIIEGQCVPSSRITVFTGSGTPSQQAFTLQTAITMMSTSKPYLRITNVNTTGARISASALNDLPALYIIGPMADVAPSQLGSSPPAVLTNGTGQGLAIASGVHTVVEGLVFNGSNVGLECTGGGNATRVSIIRSIFTGNGTAIKSSAGCELSLDSSWVGKLFGLSGNTKLAMDLDSTKLEVINSVFFRNGNGTDAFQGVQLQNTAALNPLPLIRIVNSSIIDHSIASTTDKIYAIDCKYPTMGQMTIINSLFMNSVAPGFGFTLIAGNCHPNTTSLVGVAANEDGLLGLSMVSDSMLPYTILADPSIDDLHLSATAPSSVTGGAVANFSDNQGVVPIPVIDMEGKARPVGMSSIGAFQK